MSIQKGLKTGTKKMSLMGGAGLAFNAWSTIADYKQSRLEGHGKVGSAINAAGNAVFYQAVGFGKMLTFGAIKEAPNLALNTYLKLQSSARSMDRSSRNVAFQNSTFVDSQQAYTMRQAGMQLAEASKYNLQQTLMGNEAASMHRL